MKTMLKLLSLAAVLAASAPVAMATLLTPGQNAVHPVDTTTALQSQGEFVATTGVTDFSALTFNGSFTETVYRNATGNTVAGCTPISGCLDYVFTFTNDPKSSGGKVSPTNPLPAGVSADAILIATMANFLGYTVDADYITGTYSNPAPVSVSLDTYGTVNYNFSTSGVGFGKTSDSLVLYTNATVDSGGLFGVADGSNKTVTDFGPFHAVSTASSVPEPGSLILLGTGLLTTVGVARRKFKA
ncbi:MAG TPA: PEP-CTERM sorting domain-containing protein [Acidobacteriaceae bacterium]